MMNDCDTVDIFVYGTLMKGQHAHGFLKGGTLLGTWRLWDYAMYNLGNYPGILKKEGNCVIGEVYTVPRELLPRLDEYEAEGSLYHRRTVTVTKGEDRKEVQAYIYAREVDPDTLMHGRWGDPE